MLSGHSGKWRYIGIYCWPASNPGCVTPGTLSRSGHCDVSFVSHHSPSYTDWLRPAGVGALVFALHLLVTLHGSFSRQHEKKWQVWRAHPKHSWSGCVSSTADLNTCQIYCSHEASANCSLPLSLVWNKIFLSYEILWNACLKRMYSEIQKLQTIWGGFLLSVMEWREARATRNSMWPCASLTP